MEDILKQLSDAGITMAAIFFATAGAAVGVAYTPNLSGREAWGCIISGICCGITLPELASHYYPMPSVAKNFLALAFGVLGMYIVLFIITVGREVSKDWRVIFKWWREARELLSGTKTPPGAGNG